jgi:hypothetical protein
MLKRKSRRLLIQAQTWADDITDTNFLQNYGWENI